MSAPPAAPTPEEAARLALREVARQQSVQRTRTDMMRLYAEGRTCRGQYLLAYFGEHAPNPCGHCDNCERGPAAPAAQPFPVHSTVRHADWGAGMVLRYERDRMVVLFDDVGYKTLSVPVVVRNRLLTAVD